MKINYNKLVNSFMKISEKFIISKEKLVFYQNLIINKINRMKYF